jgi:poly [ADP-ribose] polymerase
MELEKLSKKGDLGEYMTLLDKINKYSNDFYELIPQMNYNYEKLVPISNERELDAQFSTLNQLINAQIACRILMGAKYALSSSQTNPFDYVYHSIKCKLEWMNPNEHETKYILRYIWTDKNPKIQIKSIFKFERPGEQERFDKESLPSGLSKLKNRILVWHGTGTENLLSIMSKGLLIAPNDAKWTGQRFGPGIYFSDSFANSSKFGSSGKYHSTGDFTRSYMLLCEVAMGKVKELRSSFETTESLPPGFDSVKAFGRREPDPNNNVNMPNGCIIPLGEKQEYKCKPGEGVYHRNNEQNQYIIYNESQVCIRYIVQYSVMD